MPHRVLYSQRYLYPCQLSTVSRNGSEEELYNGRRNSFAFYSPLESHMSVYEIGRDEHELIDLQGRRFMSMENVGYGGGGQFEGSVILSNDEEIMIVGESQLESKILLRHSGQSNEQIISNAFIIKGQYIQNYQTRLIYMTRNEKNSFTEINISNFINASNPSIKHQPQLFKQSQQEEAGMVSSKSIENRIRKGNSMKNPQEKIKSYKSINSQDNSSITSLKYFNSRVSNNQNSTNKLNYLHTSTVKISIPQLSSQQGQESSFNMCHSYNSLSQLVILDKQSSTISLFNLEYETLTDAIPCCGNQDSLNFNPHILHSQGRKLSILTHNLLLQYDSMALIKLIDRRIARIVQVRNLNEELRGFRDQIGQHPFQQHFIKFWNPQYQHTQQQNLSQSTQFMINFNNKIFNIDLRYNLNSVNNLQLFSAQSDQILGNYHIGKQKDSNIIGFTTENHHSFKSYVVEENH